MQRIERVIKAMKDNGKSQILVTDPSSIFYLTGKWIHAGERLLALLLKADGNHKIFINKLFPVSEDLGVEKVWFTDTDDVIKMMTEYINKEEDLGIDKVWPSAFLLSLMDKKAAKGYFNSSNIVDEIRMQKDEEEKDKMRSASRVNDEAMEILYGYLSDNPSVTELEAQDFLKETYKDLGASGFSFDPIIAFGKNCADPHHETDDSTMKEGDSVIIDIGCYKDSYASDMTRTFFFKTVSEKHKEIFEIVKNANLEAIKVVKPGATFAQVDKAARDYIVERGYGEYFTHRTGHSIGIDVHEHGDVSQANNEVLKEGMIFSIEPGIYLPNEMGVRIEDLILVTKGGAEVLNKVPKDIRFI